MNISCQRLCRLIQQGQHHPLPAVDGTFADAPAKGAVVGVVGRQGQMVDGEDVYVGAELPTLLQVLHDLCTAVLSSAAPCSSWLGGRLTASPPALQSHWR